MLVVLMIMTGCTLFFIAASLEWNIRDNWRHFLSDTVLGDYYITSITGIGDDYRFFNPVPPQKFISREIIDYLDKNHVQYTCRVRTGGKYYDERLGFRDFNKFLGIDFSKEEKILTNIMVYEGTFEPLPGNDNGMDFYWDPSWSYHIGLGTNYVYFFRAADGGNVPYKFKVNGKFDLHRRLDNAYFNFNWTLVKISFLTKILGLNPGDFTDVVIWDRNGRYRENLKTLAGKYGLKMMNPEESIGGGVGGVISFVRFIESGIVVFIIIIFLITVTNLNLMSFLERKKEFAAMLAMGFRPLRLQALLVCEMIIFSAAAFIVSCVFFIALEALFYRGFRLDFIKEALAGRNFYLNLTPSTLATAFTFVLAAVLASMAYPVALIGRIVPVEVFRNEN